MAEYLLGNILPPNAPRPEGYQDLLRLGGLMVMDEILDVTKGTANDRPPENLGKPPEKIVPGPGLKPLVSEVKAVGTDALKAVVFGYTETSPGAQLPPEQLGRAPSAEQLDRDQAKRPTPVTMLPMWKADP